VGRGGGTSAARAEAETGAHTDGPLASLLCVPAPPWQKPTSRELAQLTAALQQFQEDALGVNAPRPAPMLRLPAKLFKDLAPQGSLYWILRQCYEHKKAMDWRRFDLTTPSKRDANLQMLQAVERLLLERGLLRRPKVAFDKAVPPATRHALKPHLTTLHAEEVANAAAATHVLHPRDPDEGEDDEEWYRPLEKRDRRALVHWWYYPDSYDSWIADSDAVGDPEPAPTHRGPWHVTTRWLEDSVKFNELMNEEDYELPGDDGAEGGATPGDAASTPAKAGGPAAAASRGRSPSTGRATASSTRKRARGESPPPAATAAAAAAPTAMAVDEPPAAAGGAAESAPKRARPEQPSDAPAPAPGAGLARDPELAAAAAEIRAPAVPIQPATGTGTAGHGAVTVREVDLAAEADKLHPKATRTKQPDHLPLASGAFGNITGGVSSLARATVEGEVDVALQPGTGVVPAGRVKTEDDAREDASDAEGGEAGKAVDPAVAAAHAARAKAEAAQRETEQVLAQQVDAIVIPSYSTWFSLSDIHEVRQARGVGWACSIHPLTFQVDGPALHSSPSGVADRDAVPARVFQRQEQEQDGCGVQRVPRLYGQHVPPQPGRVPDGDGVPAQPRRRRLRHHPRPRLPRAVGPDQLPGARKGW